MAIKIKTLEQITDNYKSKQYIYKDLFLDFEQTKITSPGFQQSLQSNDIKVDYDLAAIINSLTNLFNTLPGQRFLFPEYGLDLNQFLFSPITIDNGDLIGNIIYNGIRTFEPRVTPQKVNIAADPDNSQYFVTIIINIPIFNINTGLDFLLDIKKQSFIFLETSRNS